METNSEFPSAAGLEGDDNGVDSGTGTGIDNRIDTGVDSVIDNRIDNKICGYFVHPAADEFPVMSQLEFDDLLNSTREVGQLSPVVIKGNTILEGRHRARVIEILRAEGREIELRTVEWEPTDSCPTPSQFIENVNLKRRNLTPDQRAIVATALIPHIERELAERQKASRIRPGEKRNPGGRNQHTKSGPADATISEPDPESDPPSTTEKNRAKRKASMRHKIAEQADVSFYKGDQALTVKRHGSPEQIEEVRQGKKTLAEVTREINEKRGKEAGTAGTPAKKRKPIDHPFEPTDDFEYDCLKFWMNFVTKVAGMAERPRARQVFREMFELEETPPKSRKPKGGTAGTSRKKTGPEAPSEAEERPSDEDAPPEDELVMDDESAVGDEPADEDAAPPKGKAKSEAKSRGKKDRPRGFSPMGLWGKPLPASLRDSDD